jgi:hypothetical protein
MLWFPSPLARKDEEEPLNLAGSRSGIAGCDGAGFFGLSLPSALNLRAWLFHSIRKLAQKWSQVDLFGL